MEQAEFNEKLKKFNQSKVGMKILLPSLELKKKYEDVLRKYYIEEKTHAEISEEMNITRESVANLLATARKSMHEVVNEQYAFFDEGARKLIKILLGLNEE